MKGFLIKSLHEHIIWLTGNPAGIKMNERFAGVIGGCFLTVLNYWEGNDSFYLEKKIFSVICTLTHLV